MITSIDNRHLKEQEGDLTADCPKGHSLEDHQEETHDSISQSESPLSSQKFTRVIHPANGNSPILERPERWWSSVGDLESKYKKVQWLWPGYIPRGLLTMLVAEQGKGKSLFALRGLVAPVLMGVPWPNGVPCNSSPDSNVVWLECEASHSMLYDRAKEGKLPMERILFPFSDPLECFSLENGDHLQRLKELILSEKVELVVLDAFSGCHTKKENDNQEMLGLMKKLASLAQETNVAIVVIHHVSKLTDNGALTLNSPRGASALTQYCRSVLALESPEDGVLSLNVVKSNFQMPPKFHFKFCHESNLCSFLPDYDSSGSAKESAVRWLQKHLSTGPALRSEVLRVGEKAGHSRASLDRAAKQLRATRQKGKWELSQTPQGSAESSS